MKFLILILAILSLSACSNGDSSNNSPQSLSTGLKIFVTASVHVGDFANDPLLAGSNAIEKADSFCNIDSNKPNTSVYKAMIVDGTIRDAKTLTNWVLMPNTTYYRSHGDVEIDTTTSSAIFPVLYANLTHSISDRRPESSDMMVQSNSAWSGITDLSDFSNNDETSINGTRTCNKWSEANTSVNASAGRIYENSSIAIGETSGGMACDYRALLYCVEQK